MEDLILLGLGVALGWFWYRQLRALRQQNRRLASLLEEQEGRLQAVEAGAQQAQEAVTILGAVLMDRGWVEPEQLRDARWALVDEPRRLREEEEELLKDVEDRESLAERLVHASRDRRH